MNHIQHYDFNGENLLTFLNEYNNSIYIYDAKTYSFIESIAFDVNGPKGVGKIQGYSFLNRYTICLIDTYRYKALFYDVSDKEHPKKLRDISFTTGLINPSNGMSTETNASIPWMKTYSPSLFLKNSNLYISGLPESSSKPTSEFSINLFYINSQDSLSKFSVYPKKMNDGFWEDGDIPRMAPNLDSTGIIITYQYSNSIGKTQNMVQNPSFVNPTGIFKETNQVFLSEPTREQIFNRFLNSYTVYNILADPYRNVYYRIIEEPNFSELENNGERKDSKKPIVQIFDKDINLIGEVSLPNYEYLYNMCYVSKEGLMISQPKVNYTKMAMDENTLRFISFKLEKLQK
ncbi:DUF4221 domain-containing protein [Belliella sp. DSM 107340]|uniref:DUF4221 domain-containing protein n=2 Tax=Belliella calami TaxID=2923436 RepID=A0ABS9UN73_9BACT|nr:DUF4221 domain-containing protein [Belliella calami]